METIPDTGLADPPPRPFLSDGIFILSLALIKFFIHVSTNAFAGYGYFRDELYYIACSHQMAWGYVDQPPFSIAVLWLNRLLLGDSLFALRFPAAVAGATVVALTCLMVRELGGKRFAQAMAAVCVIAAPLQLGFDAVFSMNSFEVLFWTAAFYLVILLMKNEEHWLLLGLILGLGLLNKISVLWLGAGILVGLLLTPNRRLLLRRGIWVAGGVCLLLFLPHLLWQIGHDYPTLEFMRNATSNKYVAVPPHELLLQQALFMNPVTLPLWASGVVLLLVSKSFRRFQILPIMYLTVFFILAVNGNSKAAYLAPVLPMLFAGGGLAAETFVVRTRWNWLRAVLLGLVSISGIAFAPMTLPVLPVEEYISYARGLGIAPSTSEKNELGRLPQHYADMFGWEKMVAAVAQAYHSLPPEERVKCSIFCNNYGEAGAIDFFGKAQGLPKAIAGHNTYWLWGPRGATGEVVIRLGGSEEAVRNAYSSAIRASVFTDDYCMPYENNMTIWICRNRHVSLTADWPRFKVYQ